jgi:hypothetical protein
MWLKIKEDTVQLRRLQLQKVQIVSKVCNQLQYLLFALGRDHIGSNDKKRVSKCPTRLVSAHAKVERYLICLFPRADSYKTKEKYLQNMPGPLST